MCFHVQSPGKMPPLELCPSAPGSSQLLELRCTWPDCGLRSEGSLQLSVPRHSAGACQTGSRRVGEQRVVWVGKEGKPRWAFPCETQTVDKSLQPEDQHTKLPMCVSYVWVTGPTISSWKEACRSHVWQKRQLEVEGRAGHRLVCGDAEQGCPSG